MRNGSGTYQAPSGSWNPATNGNSATAADWNTLLADIASALTQSVSADGQTPITGNLNMGNNKLTSLAAGSASGQSVAWQQLFSQGTESDIASASTVDIGAQNTNFLRVTGTTTITSFGTNYNGPRFLRFAGALTLTHNASTLILPTGANITTAAGDCCIALPISGGWYVAAYQRANGLPSSDFLNTTRINVASAGTVDLTANAPNTRHINITGTTTITGFTVASGQCYFVRFDAALTLTNGASLVTQTGANITTAAGDTCILRATAANTVEVLGYSPAGLLPSSATPLSDGASNAGAAVTYARGDHRHPSVLSGTVQAETNATGTSVDFTSIPSWVNRINVTVNNVSTSGTSNYIIQLGDNGGIETSGYTCGAFQHAAVAANSTSGFLLTVSIGAGSVLSGNAIIQRVGTTNKFTFSFVGGFSDVASAVISGGTKTTSSTFDRIRITTVGGTDGFDAGTFGVSWE